MSAKRYSYIVALLVLVAGLINGTHSQQFHSISPAGIVSGHITPQYKAGHRHFTPTLAQSSPSNETRHGEKRHGKSLVSQAIVAECPVTVTPPFTYSDHNYSLFLPGGCSRRFTGNFSLRGPPAVC
jgi:hypothetical protein